MISDWSCSVGGGDGSSPMIVSDDPRRANAVTERPAATLSPDLSLFFQSLAGPNGAVEKTRTSTAFRPQRPQRCASTSSATTAHRDIPRQAGAGEAVPLAGVFRPANPKSPMEPSKCGSASTEPCRTGGSTQLPLPPAKVTFTLDELAGTSTAAPSKLAVAPGARRATGRVIVQL
jgi:hypothetical protein